MTISQNYEAERYTWDGERTLEFTFENSGLDSFEVWFETLVGDGVYTREQVQPQYYDATFYGNKPTYVGGSVTLTGRIADTVTRISLERNTLITQECDLKNFGAFHMPTLEFMLDKLIMIVQEMVANKCGMDAGDQPMQPYRFSEYTVLFAPVVDAALGIIAFYLLLLRANGADCTDSPDET